MLLLAARSGKGLVIALTILLNCFALTCDLLLLFCEWWVLFCASIHYPLDLRSLTHCQHPHCPQPHASCAARMSRMQCAQSCGAHCWPRWTQSQRVRLTVHFDVAPTSHAGGQWYLLEDGTSDAHNALVLRFYDTFTGPTS